MPTDDFLDQVEVFSQKLSKIINGTVSQDVIFDVLPIDELEQAYIFPSGSTVSKHVPIPITSILQPNQEPNLWLKVFFHVQLDSKKEFLSIRSSVFSLVIDGKTLRSAFRIEYDRDKGSEPDNSKLGVHARSAAHVQIHGHSEEIGYIQGLNGNNKLRNLSDFHFPVGGRRFRPSLEDFIEFIHSEKLVTTLNSGWQNVLAENRGHWLEIQLKSAVRAQPDVAIKQLTEMGYQVTNGA